MPQIQASIRPVVRTITDEQPPQATQTQSDCLLYLNGNKRNTFSFKNNYLSKAAFALHENCGCFIRRYGIENVGVLDLTFADSPNHVEAKRRFRSFTVGVLKRVFKNFIWVASVQEERWVLHFHVLVDCGKDIRTGYDSEAVVERDYSSVCDHLKELWSMLRKKMLCYGFGRHHLEPIRCEPAITCYIVKNYLRAKHLMSSSRMRFCGTSEGNRVCTTRFAWNTPAGRAFRAKMALFGSTFGATEIDGISPILGSDWPRKYIERIATSSLEEVRALALEVKEFHDVRDMVFD